MARIYTAAEIDAMDAEDEAREAEESGTPKDAADAVAKSDLPEIVAFKDKLPVKLLNLDGEEELSVSYKAVYNVLGVKTRQDQWFERVCAKGMFEEGLDYVSLSHSPDTLEGRLAIKANGGHLIYDRILTADMAKEICMMDTGEVGKTVRRYFLVAEKVARKYANDHLRAELGTAKLALDGATRRLNKVTAEADKLAQKNGHHTIGMAMHHRELLAKADQNQANAQRISESGVQAQSLTLVIEQAAKRLKSVKSNPDKVLAVSEELLNALAEIQNGNLHYYPAF